MSVCNNNCTTLRQVYQDLKAGMTPDNRKVFMCIPCLSRVRFLNQLLPANSRQLQTQDCNTTVAGSEHDTVTHAEEEGVLTLFLLRLRRPSFDFLALASRIYKIGLTILSLKLLPRHLQRHLRYFALVATLKSCLPLTLPSSIGSE
ncbi:hypothetical protein DSO57_1022447 [Entomophthora muscae]|uniref:Uncharacterized protein n=1 Tax=Entomophthora muscae TaxID=34485 RepID=A0ACC2TQN7_9FUNG|nr:hypothetical protein DSO57_1022447 [Entomophthora muscae]